MSSQPDSIDFPCIEVRQPIGNFYVGRMDSQDLVAVAYSDVRRIEGRDVERILGIQRPLSEDRVRELKQYVSTVDASFPTSVILAVSSDDAEFDVKHGRMKMKRAPNVAKIIDGQHRIAGLEDYKGLDFQLNVTVFVDMDLEDQALLFATINLKQTRVDKSLAYDLYEFATGRSPQKTCHGIAKLLNSKDKSPFVGKIKILGRAVDSSETITQAAFVDRLLPYISPNPMQDRDKLRRGTRLERAKPHEERGKKLIFRNMFIDEKDAEIAKVMWNYFAAVGEVWPDAWYQKKVGNLLNRTPGFGGLMMFLPVAYLAVARPGDVAPVKKFRDIFERASLKEDAFTTTHLSLGAGGESELYRMLLDRARLELP